MRTQKTASGLLTMDGRIGEWRMEIDCDLRSLDKIGPCDAIWQFMPRRSGVFPGAPRAAFGRLSACVFHPARHSFFFLLRHDLPISVHLRLIAHCSLSIQHVCPKDSSARAGKLIRASSPPSMLHSPSRLLMSSPVLRGRAQNLNLAILI